MISVILGCCSCHLFENLSCGHDAFMRDHYKNLPVYKNLEKFFHKSSKAKTLSDENPRQTARQPIRIKFNFDMIDKRLDNRVCAGVRVVTPEGFPCTRKNRMSRGRITRLKMICEFVEDILSRLIKVTPSDPFFIEDVDDPDIHIPMVGRRVLGTDLLMFVTARPSRKTSAWSAPLQLQDNGRPVTGILNVNPVVLDSGVNDRQAWGQVLHEMFHVLGISDALYHYWVDPSTNMPYGKHGFPMYRETEMYPAKLFLVMHTPHSRKVATERYGSKEFFAGKPSGAVLEEKSEHGDMMGTYSHLKGSVYYNELMVSDPVMPMVISNVSLAMLMDTGWYDVNMSMAEPLPFGDGESMGLARSPNFAVSPPQKAFPPDFFWVEPNEKKRKCTFDYAGILQPMKQRKPKCRKSKWRKTSVCQGREYYMPIIERVAENRFYDYQPFGIPTGQMCAGRNVPEAFGAKGGPDSTCIMSTLGRVVPKPKPNCYPTYCLRNGSLEIVVNDRSIFCNREGEKHKLKKVKGFVLCPDPNRVCNMKKYMARHTSKFDIFGPMDPLGVTGRVSFSSSWTMLAVVAISTIGIACLARQRMRHMTDYELTKQPAEQKLLDP